MIGIGLWVWMTLHRPEIAATCVYLQVDSKSTDLAMLWNSLWADKHIPGTVECSEKLWFRIRTETEELTVLSNGTVVHVEKW